MSWHRVRWCLWIIGLLALVAWNGTPVAVARQLADEGPPGRAKDWHIIFQDEFNGKSLDTTKWKTCYWWGNDQGCIGGNGEMGWYAPDAETVHNGVLQIRADKRTVHSTATNQTYSYTGGLISTTGRFAFTYGYIEARVKVAKGQGLWSNFWTQPTDRSFPPELDVFEILGATPERIYMTTHYPNSSGYHASDGSSWNGPDFSSDFHVVGLSWEKDALVWYVDGIERKRVTEPTKIPNKPLEVLFNLAVGGDWPGPPDATTQFPSYFTIDWVRVWQQNDATVTPTPDAATPTSQTGKTIPHTNGTDNTDDVLATRNMMLIASGGGIIITIGLLGIFLLWRRTPPRTRLTKPNMAGRSESEQLPPPPTDPPASE